ncbi:SOS response-associated peptidase [Inquilinus sp. NPDC058860]|uniref:SOS response-associated peptidase n=1 Tax=Inquilinus sp. NPDC058860 TaxID=3346652 RepID=UPI00368381BC
MCYAKSMRKTRDELADLARYLDVDIESDWPQIEPRYMIRAPKRAVILHQAGESEALAAEIALWDLVPPGGGKPFLRANAQAEGLAKTWPWSVLLRDRERNWRCISPCDGFYEPEKPARAKGTVPWSYYERKDSGLFWLPGLWNETPGPDGKPMASYTIFTTAANSVLRVHDRMPVMLDAAAARRWVLDPEPPLDLLQPYPAELMHAWRVGDEAKNPGGRDHPGLIAPVPETATGSLL